MQNLKATTNQYAKDYVEAVDAHQKLMADYLPEGPGVTAKKVLDQAGANVFKASEERVSKTHDRMRAAMDAVMRANG